MPEKMRNPYDAENGFTSEVTLSPRWCLVVSILFFVCISVPPLWRTAREFQKPEAERWIPVVEIANTDSVEAANVLSEKRKLSGDISRTEPSLRDHLQAFEAGVKNADFRLGSRRVDQARQLRWLHDGNRKVFFGRDNRLYYRPEIDALTGYGPLRPEPDSVTKDPDRAEWSPPREVVLNFHRQLSERGIGLTLVPVPTKPMVDHSGFWIDPGPSLHPDYEKLLDQFREDGIVVVDLLPALRGLSFRSEAFLKQDTHWTTAGMMAAVDEVSGAIAKQVGTGTLETYTGSYPRFSYGDLVNMLELPEPGEFFEREKQTLTSIIDSQTHKRLDFDPDSPLVVIGDSFLNIYEDPSLGFGMDDEVKPLRAGFASHLSAKLKKKVHVIAINGEGATGVRRAFAALPDNRVRAKKHVVWVLSARDLLFSESSGLRAGVYWRDVKFNPESEERMSSDNEIVVIAKLKEKSGIQDPEQTPYADAVYSGIFEIQSVESGVYEKAEASVFLWAFEDRKMRPTAELETGKSYRLRMSPIEDLPLIKTRTRLDDFFRIDLPPLFSETAEEVVNPQ